MHILGQTAASNTSSCLPSNTAFCLRRHKSSSDILSSPTIYHVTRHFLLQTHQGHTLSYCDPSLLHCKLHFCSHSWAHHFPLSVLDSTLSGHGNRSFNPLRPELNPICCLAHHFLHVSRIMVKSLTIGLLMSYIYGAPILDVSRSHTTTQHSR